MSFSEQKILNLGEKWFLKAFWAKIFTNKTLNKKVKKHSLAICIKMVFGKFLVTFVKKIFYLQKILAPKIKFWRFFKNAVLSQKSDYLYRFLVNFLSKNVYFNILYLISFKVTTKTIVTKREGGTILNSYSNHIDKIHRPICFLYCT